jgi:hypothetical protein
VVNLLSGQEPVFVAAQFVWSALFSAVLAMLVVAGGSVWPAVLVHGVTNAIIHTNRIGVDLEMTMQSASLLAAAPIPMVIYAIFLLRARGSMLPVSR